VKFVLSQDKSMQAKSDSSTIRCDPEWISDVLLIRCKSTAA